MEFICEQTTVEDGALISAAFLTCVWQWRRMTHNEGANNEQKDSFNRRVPQQHVWLDKALLKFN